MREKQERVWKKVFESDLSYIAYELKESTEKPALIILEGPLGAGKTTFVKSFVEDEDAISPTYSVINDLGTVLHADFYRVKNREEIIQLELELYMDAKDYFFVEWGKQHLNSLLKEISEDYSVYLMEISINEHTDDSAESRNYTLYSISEY